MSSFFSKNKKNQQRQAPIKIGDSFLVDLRPLMEKPVISKQEAIKLSKHKKEKKFKKEPFNLTITPRKKRPKKIKKQRSWRVSYSSLALIKFFSWRKKRSLFHELRFHREIKSYFNEYNNYAFRQLKRVKTIKAKKRQQKKEKVLLSWYRSVFSFALILVIIILPFKLLSYFKIIDLSNLKDNVLTKSLSALENLVSATENVSKLSWDDASNNFQVAGQGFSEAQNSLRQVDDWILPFAAFAKNPDIKMAAYSKQFLNAGIAAAQMGQHLSEAGAVLEGEQVDKNWGVLIDSFVVHGELAQVEALRVQTELASIKAEALPLKYQAQFIGFRDKSNQLVEALDSLLSSASAIKTFLGVSEDKRYLLIFQNNSEMRGSGGFLGSYALVDIRNGAIKKLEVPSGGSYDTEAGMRSFIKSPEPLWLVNPRWFFWDANWWPDWPLTARSLMWFYEKSDGPTVDGVISFTPDVLEDLLTISGEIDLQEEYGLTINADNFWDLIQRVVEKPNLELSHPEEVLTLPDSPDNEPKKIIGDLMVKIMERLPQVLSTENLPSLLLSLEKNLAAKNILLYFSDDDLQASLSKFGIDASIKNSEHDYLMITHTNIAGQKTDRKMEDRIVQETEIMEDGSVINNLTIYRSHTGAKNEVLSGVRNVDWLRVYVPQGSLLLQASGFRTPDASYFDLPESAWIDFPAVAEHEGKAFTHLESATKIYKESGKTVYANWVMTDPGEISVINLKYRLPLKVKKTELMSDSWVDKLENFFAGELPNYYQYSILIQKQPGAKEAVYELSLNLPSSWKAIWRYPKDSFWSEKFKLTRDRVKAVLLEN